MSIPKTTAEDEIKIPLILDRSSSNIQTRSRVEEEVHQDQSLSRRTWTESKKLWGIVGPAILTRIANFSMFFSSQAFAGHLGDLELAALSIAGTVICGFVFGLLVLFLVEELVSCSVLLSLVLKLWFCTVLLPFMFPSVITTTWDFLLGMASALETLCGQAYGAKKYNMLGVYLQRSWIVLFFCSILTLPMYILATPVLKLLGQPADVAELAGALSLSLIPVHFSFVFQFPLQRFLQCQLKNNVNAWVNLGAFVIHIILTWLFVSKFQLGLIAISVVLNISWWLIVFGLLAYTVFGGCPETWTGFTFEAFSGLWEFLKLSISSGVMLCLENWYYKVLVVMTGNLPNAKIAVDALSICMNINGWELMIPLAFFAGTGVRVANELGAGNGKAAKFATTVSVIQSIVIGLFFWLLILFFHNEISYIFTTSQPVLEAVHKLSILLAFTILLNSVQPILSGVAVGSGWQAYVAYINLGCYYLLGVPMGIVMGWVFHFGIMGLWAGMIFGGTAVQTVILAVITARCDWDKEAEKASTHVDKWSKWTHT